MPLTFQAPSCLCICPSALVRAGGDRLSLVPRPGLTLLFARGPAPTLPAAHPPLLPPAPCPGLRPHIDRTGEEGSRVLDNTFLGVHSLAYTEARSPQFIEHLLPAIAPSGGRPGYSQGAQLPAELPFSSEERQTR